MKIKWSLLRILFLVNSLISGLVQAGDWMHGGVYLPLVPDGFEVSGIGGQVYSGDALPGSFPARIRISGASEEGIYLQSSNGLKFAYYGMGELLIERLEQFVAPGEEALKGPSRSIFSMDTGRFLLDSRFLEENSRLLLELPVGRVFFTHALASIQIRHRKNSGNFSIQIECMEGSLQFVNSAKKQFQIHSGQTIIGLGASLEVSDIDVKQREDFAGFSERCRRLLSGFGAVAFLNVMKKASVHSRDGRHELIREAAAGFRNPIVIECAPFNKLVVPRYGMVKPLSPSHTDNL